MLIRNIGLTLLFFLCGHNIAMTIRSSQIGEKVFESTTNAAMNMKAR
jgi:hypothetical protein